MLIYHRDQKLVEMAQDCLASILQFVDRNETQIIVVDNGSTARSQYWEDNADVYVRLNKNMGISRGWNCGLKLATGEYLVVVGDDITARPGWLEAMYDGMQLTNAGMCNPGVEHLPGGVGIQENYKWPSGACFMLSRNTINKVGYFAEETYFPGNWEDWDYWLRIYKAGLKIYRNYKVTVLHKEGKTMHAADLSARHNANKERFIAKWGFDATPIFCDDAKIEDYI